MCAAPSTPSPAERFKHVDVKKSKREKKEEKIECRYDIEMEGRYSKIVVRCMGCPGAHTLDNDLCLVNIMQAVSKELTVNSIVLSHYTDVEYFGSSMELIRMMTQFITHLDTFAVRDPVNEYFPYLSDKDKKKLRCWVCELNPYRIFGSLRENFIADLTLFHQNFYHLVNKIALSMTGYEECTECALSTIEDLGFIHDIYNELTKYVLSTGLPVAMKELTSAREGAPAV